MSATLAFVLPLRPRPLSGVFMVHTQEGCFLYVCTKLEAETIRSKVIRGPKISKLGHVTQATSTWGTFDGPHAVGSVLHLCRPTKFEADCGLLNSFKSY